MQIRDRNPVPFRVEPTEQFTNQFERLRQNYPRIEDIVEGLLYLLHRRPRETGVRYTEIEEAEIYVYRTEPQGRVPSFRFVYEVTGDTVILFGLGLPNSSSLL